MYKNISPLESETRQQIVVPIVVYIFKVLIIPPHKHPPPVRRPVVTRVSSCVLRVFHSI